MSYTNRVLHTATWDYFTLGLPGYFNRSSKVVKEAIMTDISDLVQEFKFWRSDGTVTVGAFFFPMRHLFKVLEICVNTLKVRFDVFATAVT